MSLVNFLQFLEPMQDQFGRIYSTMSGIIAVILVLWALNLIVGLIQRTYSTGKALGGFYRNYLHRFIKVFVVKFLSLLKYTLREIIFQNLVSCEVIISLNFLSLIFLSPKK